ncbi:MAG: 3-keto-5-aminohexanoate cleavage protein [Geminicoccaceae bacterium]
MTPLVVTVAPNGARRTKTDHPDLPITPAEIARDAAWCADAGASVLHLHVRAGDGRHSLDPDLLAETAA